MGRAACWSAFLAACAAGADVPPPRVGAIQPDRGPPDTSLAITGMHFCQLPEDTDPDELIGCVPPNAQVFFATTPSNLLIVDDTNATATVPPLPPGTVDMYLSVGGQRSNQLSFRIETAATITAR